MIPTTAMDLMGYNGMPVEKSDERNVAILKDMERLGFPRGSWPAGTSSKTESRVLGHHRGRREMAFLKYDSGPGSDPQTWNLLSQMIGWKAWRWFSLLNTRYASRSSDFQHRVKTRHTAFIRNPRARKG